MTSHTNTKNTYPDSARFNIGLLLLRVFPAIMILHGISKLGHFTDFAAGLETRPVANIAPTLFAILIVGGEIVLPALIAVGFFTRISAFFLSVMMLGIWLFVPVAGALSSGSGFITENGALIGENAIVYLFLALPVIFLGAGKYSIDALLTKKEISFLPAGSKGTR